MKTEIKFSFNSNSALELINELYQLGSELNVLESIERLLNTRNTLSKFFTVKSYTNSANTIDMTIVCNPTDLFMELIAALRAGKRDFFIRDFEVTGSFNSKHEYSPIIEQPA